MAPLPRWLHRCNMGLLALLLASALPRPVHAHDDAIDVMHWWVSRGEQASIAVLRQRVRDQGLSWHEQAEAGSGTARYINALRRRIAAGRTPTASQMIGYDIQDWAASGKLQTLDDVALAMGWDDVVPFGVQALSKYQGHWVAMPINLHSTNWLWANQALLDSLGATEAPDTWEDLVALLTQAQAAGIIPLAMGHEAWEHTLLFESVAISTGGAEFYRRVFLELDASALTQEMALRIFARMRVLSGFLDPGFRHRRWDQATDMVRKGQALLQVQGSWVDGEFGLRGMQAGADFQCYRFPDTQGVVLFNSDQYVMFKDGPGSPEARRTFQEILLDPDSQIEINRRSGAIPARVDVSKEDFDACSQRAIDDMRGANIRRTLMGSVAMGNANPPLVKRAIYDLVSRHLNGEIDDIQAAAALRLAISGEH